MPVVPAIGAALGATGAAAATVGAATLGATAAIGGGLIAAGGAKSAANTQTKAAQDALNAQNAQYQQQIALQEPFRQAGLTAQQRLMELLGLQNPAATGAATNDPAAYGLKAIDVPDINGQGGNTIYTDQQGNVVNDVNAYMAQHAPVATSAPSADFGKYAKDFSMADYQADPGYQFRLTEGQKALERSAAARGLLSSGSTLKGIENYAQGAASQEYQNAFNRYQVSRANQLNPLQGILNQGQSAANTLTSAAGVQGTNQANLIQSAGQARASGYVGGANALTGALGSIGQLATSYPMLTAQTNYLNTLSNNPYGVFGGYGGVNYGGGNMLGGTTNLSSMGINVPGVVNFGG